MGRRSMALAVGSALVAASVVGATANAAEPDPLTTLQAAVEASEKAAANGFDGTLDVRVGQKSNATDLLGDAGLWAVVPAGGLIRLHVTAAADGRWYESVRRLPGGEYLGGWGIAGPDNGWMSPAAMASSQWQADNYLAFGASRVGRTGAITGLRPGGPTRIPFRPPDEPPVSEFLPHNAWADQDWDWPSLRLAAQPDGSSIFTGSLTQPDYEGNDQCRYLNVRAVISADGLVRQSQWTRDCPRVEPETFIATSAYGPVMVKGPPSPHKTQAQALATLRPGAAKEWWSLAEAANKTCASAPRQFRSQIISVDEAGTRTETALQVDGSVTDPGSGQPSFSMTLNGAPVAGWNPAQKYWVRIGLQGLGIPDSTWQKAVTAAGVPDAQIIVDVPEKWLRSGVLPMSFVPGPAIYATSACSFVGPVDERNIDGQDGPVTRAARPNDVTLWTVGRGKPRLIVTADATGVITGITLVGKGKGRGPVYSMSRDRGAVVPAAGPAVSYQQVAAALG